MGQFLRVQFLNFRLFGGEVISGQAGHGGIDKISLDEGSVVIGHLFKSQIVRGHVVTRQVVKCHEIGSHVVKSEVPRVQAVRCQLVQDHITGQLFRLELKSVTLSGITLYQGPNCYRSSC